MAAAEGMQPFTLEEHKKFMEALDVQSEGVTGKEWERIASCVGGNRTLMEVKLHAYEYFVRLTRHCKSNPPTNCHWSPQEDFTFEQGLAECPEGDENRWERIAAMLPGKTADDVQQRYAQLILDITRINNGDEVVIHYEGPLNESFQGPIERDAATTTMLDGGDSELHEGTDGGCDDATISTYADDATKADEKTMEGEASTSYSPSVHGPGDEGGMEGEDGGEDMMELDSVMNASMAVSSTGSTPREAMAEGEGAAGGGVGPEDNNHNHNQAEGVMAMSTEAEDATTVVMHTEDQEATATTATGDEGQSEAQALAGQEGGEGEHAAVVMAFEVAEAAPEERVEAREPEPVVSAPAAVNEAVVDTKVQTDEHLGLYAEAE